MTLSTLSGLSSLDCIPESSGNVGPEMICWVFLSGKKRTENLFAQDCCFRPGSLLREAGKQPCVYK